MERRAAFQAGDSEPFACKVPSLSLSKHRSLHTLDEGVHVGNRQNPSQGHQLCLGPGITIFPSRLQVKHLQFW